MISRGAQGRALCKDTAFGGDNLVITTREVDTRESLVRLEFEMRLLCRLVFEVLLLVMSANGTNKSRGCQAAYHIFLQRSTREETLVIIVSKKF